jgi:2-amino-4-hydroxy-6-hydroxymethyldihydropteridine diphosphokinase
MARTSYAIGLGSNRRHGRHGAPAAVLRAAIEALGGRGIEIRCVSKVGPTPPLGPAGRSFANAAVLVATDLDPPQLLAELKCLERSFGRRGGRRWGPRVIDLDILLWSEGPFEAPGLVIPHPAMRERAFVLDPLSQLVPGWRDAVTGLTVRQLRSRLMSRTPVDPTAARS